jgi:protein SCO1/2
MKHRTRSPRSDSGGRAPIIARRQLAELAAGGASLVLLAGCEKQKWNSIDISGGLPPLAFTMTRAEDGKEVTQAEYRGQIVLLYFGYTNCPDVCPTTLSNIGDILKALGPDAQHVRMLFVTVDPNRDTAKALATYVSNFSNRIDGLRGTPDQLAALARRYRVAYSVTPASDGHSYEVTHSPAVYGFNGSGAARLIIASLASTTPHIPGTAADLKRLVEETHPSGFFAHLLAWV